MFHLKKRMKRMSKKEAREKYKDVEFEKGDGLAIFIAALITFLPIVFIVGAVYLLFYFFLFH